MNRVRVQALMIKEFYQIRRDPSCFLIAVVFPLLLLFIYGFGVSLDITHLRIGLLTQDSSYEAEQFADSLRHSSFFNIYSATTADELQSKLVDGSIKGYIIIPSYFGAFLKGKTKQAPLYVVSDGSDPNTANFVQNYIQGAWQVWLQQYHTDHKTHIKPPIAIESRCWFNEELNSRYFLIPGSIAIIMTMTGTLLTALVITREWERGTIEALMTTPMTMKEFLLSKVLCYFTLGMISMTICVIVAIWMYDLPFEASALSLFGLATLFLLAAISIGLLISTIANNQFVAAQMSSVTAFLPAFMLSGFIFDIASMPFLIRLITHIFPARYMVSNLQTLFLAGNVWELFFRNALAMIVITLILQLVISKKTKKMLRSDTP